MKMKLWKRLTVMAFALLGVLAIAAVLLEAFDCGFAATLRDFVTSGEGTFNVRNLCIFLAACALLTALCVCVFMIALNSGRVKKAQLITLEKNDGDCILIAQNTLDTLVYKAIGEPQGVSEIKVVTGYQDGMVEAMIDIAVSSNINIPKTTGELQERVRHQLSDLSGIHVSRVNVTISKINVPEDGESELPADALNADTDIEPDAVDEPTEAAEAADETAVDEAVEEVAEEAEAAEPAETVEAAEPAEPAEAVEAAEPAEQAEPEEAAAPAGDAEEPFFSPEVDFDTSTDNGSAEQE